MTNLKRIRGEKNISQSKLSEISGVNIRLIQDYEQEHKQINNAKAISVYRLAEALGCTVGDILELNEEV
jgi:transcriptional regulator with XRE-family HTH domain